jgi:hypothetical protein
MKLNRDTPNFRRRRTGDSRFAPGMGLALALALVFSTAAAFQTVAQPSAARSLPTAASASSAAIPEAGLKLTTDALLDSLQRTAFLFFWNEANPVNGLIRDRNQSWSPCSIASQGFGISAICIGIDHGWVSREDGRARIMLGMQTLWDGPQGDGAYNVNGYRGLFYHFLDFNSGYRTWDCELSTIDTALLMAGILDAKQYFSTDDPGDIALRDLADSLYYRVDWDFMRGGAPALRMGWKPGTEFSGFGYWLGYNEAMILYLLALGSPTHAIPASNWDTWTGTYDWATYYGQTYVVVPPLFGHQYSHCWIDFRGIQDAYMRDRGIDYFENSRRATLAQQAYCIDNPYGWAGYSATTWGLTASDDPDGYLAHGAPPAQNDNGTITPTAAASSIVFAPEIVIPTLHNFYDAYGPVLWGEYGFKDAFNLTRFWWGTDNIGIDQGPIIIMIENYLGESVWDRFMENPDIANGLAAADFQAITAVRPDAGTSVAYLALGQNAPNPFSGTATVSYRVAEPGPVSLRVYDAMGRCVRTFSGRAEDKGPQQIVLDAAGLPSGVYFYSLEAHGRTAWRRCVVVQ